MGVAVDQVEGWTGLKDAFTVGRQQQEICIQ